MVRHAATIELDWPGGTNTWKPFFFADGAFFLPGKPWYVFTLCKKGKTLQCNLDMSVHSCRGRHVENRLKSI